jgi:hypothetical protein
MNEEKIKCWVVYDEEYPGGMIYEDREDALESSKDTRDCELRAYTRVKYFTREELEALAEAD